MTNSKLISRGPRMVAAEGTEELLRSSCKLSVIDEAAWPACLTPHSRGQRGESTRLYIRAPEAGHQSTRAGQLRPGTREEF